MKFFQFGYAALLSCLIAVGISGCQHGKSAEIIVKDEQGFYHIDGNPESLDLKMASGGIVFSRGKAFYIGAAYPGKDFCWSDDGKDFFVCYDGNTLFDFNRDFLFDLLYKKQKYHIRFDGKFIEVKKPDFQAMQAVALDGAVFHWDGNNWLKQP